MNLHVLIFIVSFSVAITVALHLNNGDGFDGPIVHTKNGQVMGTIESTLLDHRKYYAFRGIPYGRAPIDALRFKAPVKAAPWTGVWNGSNFGSPCAQPTMYMNNFYGHEDCLTLNVFSSDVLHKDGLPVIIYIHGGAFLMGTGRGMGPDIILNENIVLVTINYRLGPFGFLTLRTPTYSGNMGLKDQLLAMKWVRDNIRNFGGDPERVTLYGHSAGAVSVHMHILSTASRGLFKRAILSGASALVPWAYGNKNHTNNLAETVARSMGVSVELVQLNQIIEWLHNVDTVSFGMENIRDFFVGGKRTKSIDFTWMPVVEAENSVEPFFTKSVYEYLQETNEIDTIFIFTEAESLLLTGIDLNAPETLKSFDEHFEVQLPLVDLIYDFSSAQYKAYAKEIRQFYFGNKSINSSTLHEYVELLSDTFFAYGIHRAVETQVNQSLGKTYLLKFSGDLKLNFFRKFANGSELDIVGATHTEEMCYVFRLSEMENLIDENEYNRLVADSPEALMSKSLIRLIANFADSGNPTPEKTPVDYRPIENTAVFHYLNVTNDGYKTDGDPHRRSMTFWNNFFQKHKTNLFNPLN